MHGARDLLERFVREEADDWDVIGWALEQRAQGNDVPALIELSELDVSDPNFSSQRLLERLVACVPGADAWTAERIRLLDSGRALLDGKLSPVEFCARLGAFEQLILDEKGPYPSWLGELWHACDWCEAADLAEAPHLRDGVVRMLREGSLPSAAK